MDRWINNGWTDRGRELTEPTKTIMNNTKCVAIMNSVNKKKTRVLWPVKFCNYICY